MGGRRERDREGGEKEGKREGGENERNEMVLLDSSFTTLQFNCDGGSKCHCFRIPTSRRGRERGYVSNSTSFKWIISIYMDCLLQSSQANSKPHSRSGALPRQRRRSTSLLPRINRGVGGFPGTPSFPFSGRLPVPGRGSPMLSGHWQSTLFHALEAVQVKVKIERKTRVKIEAGFADSITSIAACQIAKIAKKPQRGNE